MQVNNNSFNAADEYCKYHLGKSYQPNFTDISDEQGKRIADAFIQSQTYHQYNDRALFSYELFKVELLAQWNWLTKVWLIEMLPWQGEGQPYANSQELFDSILRGEPLYFFLTEQGFGSDADYSQHPLLAKTDIVIAGVELVYNDLFRAVHDFFGHSINGWQFGPKGETKAWQSHLAMFESDGARQALTNEAQGQTCWFNYGPHIRRADGSIPTRQDVDFVAMQDRPYAEQSVAVMPWSVFAGLI